MNNFFTVDQIRHVVGLMMLPLCVASQSFGVVVVVVRDGSAADGCLVCRLLTVLLMHLIVLALSVCLSVCLSSVC